jgi:hypothetical protein
MSNDDLGLLALDAWDALTARYSPAIDAHAETLGFERDEWYGWLMAAHIFEPDPVSAARLGRRSAYTASSALDAYLAKGERLGLLRPVGPGEYRLTDAGHVAVRGLINAAYAAMAPYRPLPEDDLERLAGLVYRLVQASLAAPEPPGKWCLHIARHYDPGANAPVVVRLDQYLSDLNAYRDDAHLASWQPYGISGQAWESLTVLWYGDAKTLDELSAKLARRGYRRDDYAAALDDLARRGWVAQDGDTWRLTALGQSVRDEAEALTNRYFYLPWTCLDDVEKDRLRSLLDRFQDALRLGRY